MFDFYQLKSSLLIGLFFLCLSCTSEHPSEVSFSTLNPTSSTPHILTECQNEVGTLRISRPLEEAKKAIYGGQDPHIDDPMISSTIALFSKSDLEYDFASIDGSATLISPTVALGAGHTCDLFNPQFASVGIHPPHEIDRSFEEHIDANPQGSLVRVIGCLPHPDYIKEAHRPNDLALFYLSHQPKGSQPAALIDPSSSLPSEISIVGYGARSGQFDRWWEEIEAYRLQRVDTWISKIFESRGLFMDGPNPGHGSCQGDSGGPLYHRVLSPIRDESSDDESSEEPSIKHVPLLLGSVVMGPECDEGIGYNTDLRQYIDWIQEQDEVDLILAQPIESKTDLAQELIHCP